VSQGLGVEVQIVDTGGGVSRGV